jgi:hypothetical protein
MSDKKRNDKYNVIKENYKSMNRKALILMLDQYGSMINILIETHGSECLGDIDE